MLHKRDLKLTDYCKLCCLSLKSIKAILLLSFVLILFAVPLINYGNYKTLGISDELKISIIRTARRLIPFACILPSVLLLRQFVEAEGKEMMHIYLSDTRVLLTVFTVSFTALFSVPLFIVYSLYFKGMWLEFVKIICICILLYGLSFLSMSLTRSTAVSLLILIVYEVFIIADYSDSPINYVMFNENSLKEYEYWLYIAFIGAFLSFLGNRLMKVFKAG